ncbi:RNA polymerase sigma factor [Caballeronia sp. SBC2]|uniref:RNA polymerase sigma factor n=1 Tax=Caballeronia sp. SBC2 TaxID=2705547 RepID=UPI0013E1D6AC|nr:sigma-70 family RNA polymerase sigma factor [Caballeronia sp. SBC2]QIE29741.1 ECF RNA polymerase sigma factor SigK [Caballeronia sp. SBC2]
MTTQPRDKPTVAVLVQLLERIAVHDAAALRLLYDLTSPRLFSLAIRTLRRREWAEEVLQEAYINIWRFAAQYKTSASPPMVWMTVIVRNRAFGYLRQRKAFASREAEWSEMLDDVLATDMPDPLELVLLSHKARQLATCMGRLDANQRRALELAYFCDLSHNEVAAAMNAPLGTVKGWIRRGTENLKISLEALEGITSTSTPREAKGGNSFQNLAISVNQD